MHAQQIQQRTLDHNQPGIRQHAHFRRQRSRTKNDVAGFHRQARAVLADGAVPFEDEAGQKLRPHRVGRVFSPVLDPHGGGLQVHGQAARAQPASLQMQARLQSQRQEFTGQNQLVQLSLIAGQFGFVEGTKTGGEVQVRFLLGGSRRKRLGNLHMDGPDFQREPSARKIKIIVSTPIARVPAVYPRPFTLGQSLCGWGQWRGSRRKM
ncbi:hypothetical protein D3C87_1396780 [compost metagenome]